MLPGRPALSTALFASALALAMPAAGAAQNAAILVRASGPDGPIASASIELSGPHAVTRITATDSTGVARLVGIPPGEYRLRVEAIGYRTRTLDGIVLVAHQARVVDVMLDRAPVQLDAIQVRTERIQIQRENTEFSTTVDEVAIELLPVAYDANELVALTPGARAGHVWGGANFQANSYQIDGLSANHPGLGGAMIEPSTSWIERVEVRGLGSGAEHGGFQGGQVNIVTKRGTNDFSAMLRTSMENDLLSASNLVRTEIGSEVADRYDVEGEVRGPLVRDRLFYYLGATRVDRSARVLNHLNSVEGKFSPVVEERREHKVFGKLTWAPRTADEIELSAAFLDNRTENYGMTGFEDAGAATDYSAPTWFANLAWRHSLGDWGNIEARLNHFARDERQDPYQGADRPGTQFYAVIPPYTRFNNAPYTLRSAPTSTSGTLVNTFRFATGAQEHILRVGGEYTRGTFLDRRLRNGGMTWLPVRTAAFDADDPSTWRHASASWTPTEWGGEVRLDADVVNAAAFAQAAISLGPRVVLSPGVRWGYWEGWMTPNEGGRFRAVADQAIDPRIGATVELVEDGSLVLKGHWGRFHQNMIAQMFDRAAGTDVFTNQEIWYYRGDPPTDPFHRFTRAERDALAEQGLFTREAVITLNETGPVVDYDQPYIDQWVAGIEKEFGSAKVEMLYTRRSNHDMVALVDRNRATNFTRYERVRVHDADGRALPFEGGSVYLHELYVPNDVMIELLKFCAANPDVCAENGSNPPGLTAEDTLTLSWNPDYVLTNAPDARREFQQFQLSVEVARPTWGGSFSIAVTGLEGNLDNVSGYADPDEYSPGQYVRLNEGVNADGILPNFSEREAKVSVWGQLPWRLRGGLFWTYASGDHYSPRFRLSGQGFYQYRVNAEAGQPSRCCPYQPGTPGNSGDLLWQGLMAAVEGQYVHIGPRGAPQHQRRSNVNVRLERMFEFDGFDLGMALDVFNVLGLESVTQVQTMVNNGQNFTGFLSEQPVTGMPWSVTPGNEYYKAVLGRVPPRTLRVGATVYF